MVMVVYIRRWLRVYIIIGLIAAVSKHDGFAMSVRKPASHTCCHRMHGGNDLQETHLLCPDKRETQKCTHLKIKFRNTTEGKLNF